MEDIYKSLAETIKKLTGAEKCIIYEISNSKNTISLVYPENIEPLCKLEILFNADLCRVKRTSHTVNPLSFGKGTSLCKYFRLFDKYYHICFPLMSGGNVGGVVHLLFDKKTFSQKSPDRYNTEDYTYGDRQVAYSGVGSKRPGFPSVILKKF